MHVLRLDTRETLNIYTGLEIVPARRRHTYRRPGVQPG